MTGPRPSIIHTDNDTVEVRFERHLVHPARRVWDALTDPAQIAVWFTPARLEPGMGGAVHLDFGDEGSASGTITTWDPPHVLEYTWAEGGHESIVRWELHTEGDNTHLVLTHRSLRSTDAADFAAGWQVFVDRLGVHLGGGDVRTVTDQFDALRDGYAATGGSSSVTVT